MCSITNFLDVRDERIDMIEIAHSLYVKIGQNMSDISRPNLDNDPYYDGCMYQYFAYNQQILIHFIFNNIISIIGSYDKKKHTLKSWERFDLSEEDLKSLKIVRRRYEEIRNNYLSHINAKFKLNVGNNILTDQIKRDLNLLKDILNSVRSANEILTREQVYDDNEQYAVMGIQRLFEKLRPSIIEAENLT